MNTVWILGDQLSLENAALACTDAVSSRVLMIESRPRGGLHRYHQLKLVLVYSAMRHFARDLRARGWQVDYVFIEEALTFETGLKRHLSQYEPATISIAEPNSFLETDVVARIADKLGVSLDIISTTQFLVTRIDFRDWAGDSPRLLMENHYREIRKRFGWLMHKSGEPIGGAWNFDTENRATFAAWKRAGRPRALTALHEAPDAITQEVIAMVTREFADHPGRAGDMWLPVDRDGARHWLATFIRERLAMFGVYEDMMAEGEPHLFHSVLSPLLNIGLLSPRECIEAALAAYERGDAPLNSVEGFIRQIAGWREFVNGIYWLRGRDYTQLNELDAQRALPAFVYTADTPMNCMHQVLKQTIDLGWNHHIQRLMVLGNFFLLAGVRPQESFRWFMEMYVDAFDWVMAANVIGMSQHADGGFMATKPYIATSSYIRKMSDHCKGCAFDPDVKTGPRACPFNYLYWDFIDRHAARFAKNTRMQPVVRAWLAKAEGEKESVRGSAGGFLRSIDESQMPPFLPSPAGEVVKSSPSGGSR